MNREFPTLHITQHREVRSLLHSFKFSFRKNFLLSANRYVKSWTSGGNN